MCAGRRADTPPLSAQVGGRDRRGEDKERDKLMAYDTRWAELQWPQGVCVCARVCLAWSP